MNVQTYISALKEKQNISYMQLAKDIGISYQNMMDLKNGKIANISMKILKKLSSYEKRGCEDILLDLFFSKEQQESMDEYDVSVALYLCHLYTENYSISFNPKCKNKISIRPYQFGGLANKKRVSNNTIAIDSWTKLKMEHWQQFKQSNNVEYTQSLFTTLFNDEKHYIINVIWFGISKILYQYDTSIKTYYILFHEKDVIDIPAVESFIPNDIKLNINIIKYTPEE